ncbi:hypothetical protein DERF_011892 [Dermatophagoides farinae]|uniref:Uncharacterized protein n=1 Tax=Dermatophagoides farinae TaxID=6954 RepID=A0A922HR37_DERFA|nr:hypothetical protein DERF_011892 [Dermatophagoides farinae]
MKSLNMVANFMANTQHSAEKKTNKQHITKLGTYFLDSLMIVVDNKNHLQNILNSIQHHLDDICLSTNTYSSRELIASKLWNALSASNLCTAITLPK